MTEQVESIDKLKFLSFNVGLLRMKIAGITAFSNPPYANERLPHIPEKIRSVNADIVSLQECYEKGHADFIISSLADLYPYHARHKSGGLIKFHNGLLFLSKFPIIHSHIEKLEKVALLEAKMATKCLMAMDVDIPSVGLTTFVNVHTTAGGVTHPENADVDTDREDELRQCAENCELTASGPRVAGIIIGDLNCGPEASKANYDYLLRDERFRDAYVEAEAAGKLLPGPSFSWDPANYLNKIGPHAECPGQRCDHVFIAAGGALDDWGAECAQLVFAEQFVDIGLKSGELSTLSDHHGLVVEIKRGGRLTTTTSLAGNNDV